jgi:hypothetical protein
MTASYAFRVARTSFRGKSPRTHPAKTIAGAEFLIFKPCLAHGNAMSLS